MYCFAAAFCKKHFSQIKKRQKNETRSLPVLFRFEASAFQHDQLFLCMCFCKYKGIYVTHS